MHKMSIMRSAFENALVKSEGELKKQINRGLKTTKSKKKLAADPVDLYEKRLKRTFYTGWQDMVPCSFQDWMPGTPALAGEFRGRVLWGLISDQAKKVAVQFDTPQAILGEEKRKTLYAIVDVAELRPCDCGGYTHTKHCAPKVVV